MGDFLRQVELGKAMSRWRWAYGVIYLAAGVMVVWGILVGLSGLELSPSEAAIAAGGWILGGIVVGGLAWGLHKRLSMACMIILFLIALLEAIGLSVGDEPSGDAVFAWICAFIMLRSVLSIRLLRRFRDEMWAKGSGEAGEQGVRET